MNECEALVERHWQVKVGVLGENPVPVPLCPSQASRGLVWD